MTRSILQAPSQGTVPRDVYDQELTNNGSVADYLSDKYGWLVSGWSLIGETAAYVIVSIQWDFTVD